MMQLERLNAEQAARTKRERRRANEVKTKTIQRMQLQMTAPMDIGMEQHDASLGFGQEDVFDLTGAERGMRKKGGVGKLTQDDEMPESDTSETENGDDDDDEVLDSEEEREQKVTGLEAELDGMYDAYQERMKERDAKFKVTEARKKSGLLEEWHGIKRRDSDDEDEESEEEGGWEKMEEAKEKAGADSSADESEEDEDEIEEEPPKPARKRRIDDSIVPPPKRMKLLTKLEEPKASVQSSRAAQVWFSQDVFAGLDGLDAVDEYVSDDDVSMADGAENAEEDGWEDEASFSQIQSLRHCNSLIY